MSKLHKLISNSYDPVSGIAEITLEIEGENYTGRAIASPEDLEYASRYAGFTIAEIRAVLAYHKAKGHEEEYRKLQKELYREILPSYDKAIEIRRKRALRTKADKLLS